VAELATERMVVTATPEQCFAVVSDIERYPEWAADIKQVVIERRDDEGRPAQATFRAGAFGRSTSYTLTYDYSLDGNYRFDAAGDGSTEVTYTLEVELRVPLPGFIKRRAQSRIMHTALEELKARVESSLTT
jgi:ribosome-associated toxin RatA of RatAB toxin-antitoxin module